MSGFKRLFVGLVATTTVLATGCSADPDKPTAAPTTASTPTPTPKPTRVTHAQYQAVLTGIGASFQPFLAEALAARTLAGVAAARAQLATVFELNSKALAALEPPPALEDVHSAVERIMRSYNDLREPFTLDRTKNSCGLVDPPDIQLFNAKIAVYYAIKSASYDLTVQDLTKAKLTFGKNVIPASPDRPIKNRRGVNGRVLQRAGAGGSGRLQITNEADDDAVVVASSTGPKTPQASIYVRSGGRATLTGLRGTYRVYIKSGADWDSTRRNFSEGCRYGSFLSPFDARTVWRIGLTASDRGNTLVGEVPAF